MGTERRIGIEGEIESMSTVGGPIDRCQKSVVNIDLFRDSNVSDKVCNKQISNA